MKRRKIKLHKQIFTIQANWKLLLTLLLITLINFCTFSLYAQNTKTVKGVVLDELGETLIGATVVQKNTTKGTVTDMNGEFSLEIPTENQILVISYLGMDTQEINVSAEDNIRIVLRENRTQLDEVIVVGYGVAKKRDLTGAISQVRNQELMATAPITIQEALRGKAAGVMVAGGGVNSDPMIRIRGNRSISASNEPLFVIDGIPVTGGMSTINPADVASVEVLKDASATAIYGSRGANGVILVTTKKGESGKVTVDYTGFISVGKVDNYRRVRDAAEFVEYIRDANRSYVYDGEGGYQLAPNSKYYSEGPSWVYDQQLESFLRDDSKYVMESIRKGWDNGTYNPSKVRDFNWQKAGMRDEMISHNHNISVRGGSKDTKVFMSGAFIDYEDLTPRSFRKRYTLRLNLDQTINKRVTVGAITNFAYWEYFNGIGIGGNWNPLGTPYYSPGGSGDYGIGGDVTKDGDPALGLVPHPTGEGMLYNPFLDMTGVQGITKRNRIDLALYTTVDIYNGLRYRANFGTDFYTGQAQDFRSAASTSQGFGNARASQDVTFDRGWTFEHILNYDKAFNKHSLNLTLVQATQKFISEPLSATGIGLPIESQMYYNLGSATTQAVTSGYTQWTMMSWMGRAIYGFNDNRYMLTASVRYDGASRLAEGHKWVAFPSASLAWRVSDEPWLQSINNTVSNLKLRVGYGKTGNSAVNPYATIGQITNSRYIWGEHGVLGYSPSSLSSPTLTWETTAQYNLGIDFGLLKGRISGSVDLYKQNTHNLLMPRVLPEVSGFGSIIQNVGETENRGIEVSIQFINIDTRTFKWDTNLQFSANKEQITKLTSGMKEDVANMWFVGHSIDTYYDYVDTKYVWGYSKEDMQEMAKFNANGHSYKPGDYRFVDLNGDYKITAEDRTFRGQKMPKWNLGMANNLSYRNFDLFVFMYGMFGHTVYTDPGVN